MSDKNHITDDALEQEAPILFGIAHEKLEAPQGYFESLADRVISTRDATKGLVHPISSDKPTANSFTLLWKLAAGVAILLGLYMVLKPNEIPQNQVAAVTVTDTTQEELDYLFDIEDEIYFEMMAENMQEQYEAKVEYLLDNDDDLLELLNLEL